MEGGRKKKIQLFGVHPAEIWLVFAQSLFTLRVVLHNNKSFFSFLHDCLGKFALIYPSDAEQQSQQNMQQKKDAF